MTCCDIGLLTDAARARAGDLSHWVREPQPGIEELELVVPGLSSPELMPKIEASMKGLPGVLSARVNLTARRLVVRWQKDQACGLHIMEALAHLGLEAQPFDAERAGSMADQDESAFLLRSLAVAGFAAMNIMLLSVSVWSGAEAVTRDLFHWLSALIALPAVAYAGRPFFRGALAALTRGQLNMDVPISLAVILAALMSLYQTIEGGAEAYFDASVSLLFFLLAGRVLDQWMRARARSAVTQLISLASTGAVVISPSGERQYVTAAALKPGMRIQVAAGERLAADGIVVEGKSDLDRSLVSGETVPETIAPGSVVHAGTLNLTGSLIVEVTAAGEDSFLSEVIRLMLTAEQGKSRYVQLAEKLAGYYAPAVHILAFATIAGWLIYSQGDWHLSLMTGVAVLIITCPCALGLAVPAVQVVASGSLFRNGVMIKDGAALEKLSHVDMVIFDKTGTLTLNEFHLVEPKIIPTEILSVAAGLAQSSRHPLAQGLFQHVRQAGIMPANVADVREIPGEGLAAYWQGSAVRLGSRHWCGLTDEDESNLPEIVFQRGASQPIVFRFEDQLRPDAKAVVDGLISRGIQVEILSGDREAPVAHVAKALGIQHYQAKATPQVKLAYVEGLARAGRKVLMVGDGLNDAPALAAGFTSMAPSSASDIGRTTADSVFMGESLLPVLVAQDAAVKAQRLAKQNFGLAIAYNLFAIPVAVLGFASPFFAAIAMSTSSILVVSNALRLSFMLGRRVEMRGVLSKEAEMKTQTKMEKAA